MTEAQDTFSALGMDPGSALRQDLYKDLRDTLLKKYNSRHGKTWYYMIREMEQWRVTVQDMPSLLSVLEKDKPEIMRNLFANIKEVTKQGFRYVEDTIALFEKVGVSWPEFEVIKRSMAHERGKGELPSAFTEARDPSHNQQIKMVQSQASSIGLLDNPAPDVQLIALKKNPAIARHIRNTISSDVWDDPEVKHSVIRLLLSSIRGDREALDKLHNTYHTGPEEYLDILRSRGCSYPEFDVIEKSLAHNKQIANEALYRSQNTMKMHREAQIRHISHNLEAMEQEISSGNYRAAHQSLSLAMYPIHDLGPGDYALEILEQHKSTIIRIMLWLIKTQTVGIQRIRELIMPGLQMAGMRWPELDVIEQSMNAGPQVANEDREQHKKEEAQSTARRISVGLHLMDHTLGRKDNLVAEAHLIDAMWQVTNLRRSYYHLALPIIENYKNSIIKMILILIQEHKMEKVKHPILSSLFLADVRWPELLVIQRSLTTGHKPVDEARPTQSEYVRRMSQNIALHLANPEYVSDAFEELEYIFFHFKPTEESPELASLRDILDKHKPAVVRYLLEMIKQGNTGHFANWETQLRLYMSLLTKSLSLRWPELATIKQSLQQDQNKPVAEAELAEAPRMTDIDRKRRVEQDASSMIRFRNPSADLQRYFLLMCLRKRLWSNTSNPLKIMLHQINNFRPEVLADPEVKTAVMTYMLTDVRLYIKHPKDLVRSNTIYRNIRRLQQLGADWPELNTIKTSLDVQVPSEQQPVTVGEAELDEAGRRLPDEVWIERVRRDPEVFSKIRNPSLPVQQAFVDRIRTWRFASDDMNRLAPHMFERLLARFPDPDLVWHAISHNYHVSIPDSVWNDANIKAGFVTKMLKLTKDRIFGNYYVDMLSSSLQNAKRAGCPYPEIDVILRSVEHDLNRNKNTVDEAAKVARIPDEEWIERIEQYPGYFWQTRRPSLAVQQAYIKAAPTFKFLSKGKTLNKISPELYASVIKRFPKADTILELAQNGNAIPADAWADPEVKKLVMPKLLSDFKFGIQGWSIGYYLDELQRIKRAGCPWPELDIMIRSGEQEYNRNNDDH